MAMLDINNIIKWITEHVRTITAETFALMAVVLIHASTIPTLIAVLTGLSDKMPTVDMVLLTWAGLSCLFIQATIQKNMIQIITISTGFLVQSSLMALIFFK